MSKLLKMSFLLLGVAWIWLLPDYGKGKFGVLHGVYLIESKLVFMSLSRCLTNISVFYQTQGHSVDIVPYSLLVFSYLISEWKPLRNILVFVFFFYNGSLTHRYIFHNCLWISILTLQRMYETKGTRRST